MEFIDLKRQYQACKRLVDQGIAESLASGQFILGKPVELLEQTLARRVGARHAVAVGSGTRALELALMCGGVGSGDEVITTPFTFIATVEAIARRGAHPVFVDILPGYYTLDPEQLESAITPRTRAILPVSLFGQCAKFEAINYIAKRHHIPVVEDGCQSFGAARGSKFSCGISDFGCTSFYPSKPLGCYGDGGMVFTNDDSSIEFLHSSRRHGLDKKGVCQQVCGNSRLDNLQAGVLLAKLSIFDAELKCRADIANRYNKALDKVIITPAVDGANTHVYAQYTVECEEREGLREAFKKLDIPFAIHYPVPLHLHPPFAYLGYKHGEFPVAEKVCEKVISLPFHPYLTVEEQEKVIHAVSRAG